MQPNMRLNMEKLSQVLLLPDEDMLSLAEVGWLFGLRDLEALWGMVSSGKFPPKDISARHPWFPKKTPQKVYYWYVSTIKKYLGVVP